MEVALGSYVGVSQELGGEFSLAGDGVPLADAPEVWSDGSLVLDGFSGVDVAGFGVYAWFGRQWGHLDLLPPLPDGAGEGCRLYCSIPGPLQTVQRAEIWGVLAAFQGYTRMHAGVDNLNVVRPVSRIIDGGCIGKPFPLVNDGDLLFKIQQFVRWRGPGTSAVSKVEGHADEGLWLPWVGFVRLIVLAKMKRMLLLIWVGGVFIILLLLLGEWLLGLVHVDTR